MNITLHLSVGESTIQHELSVADLFTAHAMLDKLYLAHYSNNHVVIVEGDTGEKLLVNTAYLVAVAVKL